MNQKAILISLAFLWAAFNLQAQEKPETEVLEFSLNEAQEYAIEHAYDIVAARLEMEKADKQIGETRASGLPQINASAEYQNFLDIATQLIPAQIFDTNAAAGEMLAVQFGTKHNMTAGITVSQLIFSGSYIVALKASKAYKSMSVLSHKSAMQTVKDNVRQAYYAVLISDEMLSVLADMENKISKNLTELEAMNKVGFVEETDVDQMRLLRSSVKTQKLQASNQLEIAQKVLKYNLGIDLAQPITLKEKLNNLLSGFDVEAYLAAEFAVENNVGFQSAKNMVKIAKLQVQLEQSMALPTLSAYLSHQRSANRNELNFGNPDEQWFPTSVLGLTLTIPIFSGLERHYKIQKAKVDMEIANNQLQQVGEGLKLEFATSKSTYNNTLEMYKNSELDKGVAKKIYDRTLIKYEKGVGSSLDLLQTHNQYLEKETQYYSALLTFLNAKSKLEKVLTKFE